MSSSSKVCPAWRVQANSWAFLAALAPGRGMAARVCRFVGSQLARRSLTSRSRDLAAYCSTGSCASGVRFAAPAHVRSLCWCSISGESEPTRRGQRGGVIKINGITVHKALIALPEVASVHQSDVPNAVLTVMEVRRSPCDPWLLWLYPHTLWCGVGNRR